ncbi:MAG TPA: hypothetical protein PLK54_07835 [Ferruginibacter sp.]|nr:hypothetical protein [Ferruginibacter sp.]
MKKTVLVVCLLVIATTTGFSQSDKFWTANTESRNSIVTDKAVDRLSFPKEFKLFNLNAAAFRQQLFSVVDVQVVAA